MCDRLQQGCNRTSPYLTVPYRTSPLLAAPHRSSPQSASRQAQPPAQPPTLSLARSSLCYLRLQPPLLTVAASLLPTVAAWLTYGCRLKADNRAMTKKLGNVQAITDNDITGAAPCSTLQRPATPCDALRRPATPCDARFPHPRPRACRLTRPATPPTTADDDGGTVLTLTLTLTLTPALTLTLTLTRRRRRRGAGGEGCEGGQGPRQPGGLTLTLTLTPSSRPRGGALVRTPIHHGYTYYGRRRTRRSSRRGRRRPTT